MTGLVLTAVVMLLIGCCRALAGICALLHLREPRRLQPCEQYLRRQLKWIRDTVSHHGNRVVRRLREPISNPERRVMVQTDPMSGVGLALGAILASAIRWLLTACHWLKELGRRVIAERAEAEREAALHGYPGPNDEW